MSGIASRGRPALIEAAGLSFFPVALLARLPFAMLVVGIITAVTATQGLALGGVTAAVVGLSTAAIGPVVGVAADRFGQRRTLLIAGTANTLAVLGFAAAVSAQAPAVVILGTGLVVGATAPQVGPMSRARLTELVRHRIGPERRDRAVGTVMSYESAVDESVFVVGPVLAGVLAFVDPVLPLWGAAAIAAVFVTAFALHPTAALARGHAAATVAQGPISGLFAPRVLIVAAGTFGVGLLFGSTLASLTGFVESAGHPEQAGLLYGVMGIGSATSALAVAWLPRRFGVPARWVAFAALIVVAAALLPLAAGSPLLPPVMVAMGLGIGPTLVSLFTLGTERSPAGRVATVMTMLGSALTVGQALAAATVGLIEPRFGPGVALGAPVVAAGVVLLAALAGLVIARAPHRAPADTTT
jgi:MFS family permease